MPRLSTNESVAEKRHFNSNERYVGIEVGARGGYGDTVPQAEARLDEHMRLTWNQIKSERPEEKIGFVQAEGTKVPIGDDRADEVILANLLRYGATRDQWPGLVREANRVLNQMA
jgi:hypothetical protein